MVESNLRGIQQVEESTMTNYTIGTVYLNVGNLDRQVAFYEDIIGLQIHERNGKTARLGAGGHDLLVLTETPDKKRVHGVTGLYHFAILVPERAHLAKSLKRFAETQTRLQGLSDHLVSEAIYLADPDGNGIEIYRDRPRDEWQMHNGEIVMGIEALDLNDVLAELNQTDKEWAGLDSATQIGHVHLHVADLDQAEDFYTNVLGFDVMMRYGSMASFLSVGGYHHHLGINTWQGVGASTPPQNSIGLRHYAIQLPNSQDLEALQLRLNDAKIPFTQTDTNILVHDPAGNGILFHL
jgi:catechol 2,3-dioxygenase